MFHSFFSVELIIYEMSTQMIKMGLGVCGMWDNDNILSSINYLEGEAGGPFQFKSLIKVNLFISISNSTWIHLGSIF